MIWKIMENLENIINLSLEFSIGWEDERGGEGVVIGENISLL
jgi:hypothetical protein